MLCPQLHKTQRPAMMCQSKSFSVFVLQLCHSFSPSGTQGPATPSSVPQYSHQLQCYTLSASPYLCSVSAAHDQSMKRVLHPYLYQKLVARVCICGKHPQRRQTAQPQCFRWCCSTSTCAETRGSCNAIPVQGACGQGPRKHLQRRQTAQPQCCQWCCPPQSLGQ